MVISSANEIKGMWRLWTYHDITPGLLSLYSQWNWATLPFQIDIVRMR